MFSLLFAFAVLSSISYASPGSTIHLYLTDSDLNTSHNGIDTISTSGLLEFSVNGIPISGPSTMKETSVNSGVFAFELGIPTTINGRTLGRGDVLLITYHDQADFSGKPKTVTNSITLSSTLSQISTTTKNVRIGEKFLLQLFEPDWNLDSRNPDTIPLNLIEFRAKGIRTTLANTAFHTLTNGLRETGPNTNFFSAKIEMPREVDGKTIQIGSTVEFRYVDTTSPSSTSETLKVTLRVGQSK